MKSINKILTLMYQEYIKEIDPDNLTETLKYSGLCSVIGALRRSNKITREEYGIIEEYLYKNKPKKCYSSSYFWISWKCRYRLLWLKKHMELTK